MNTLTRNELITLRRQLISTQKTCERMLPAINAMLSETKPATKRVSAVKGIEKNMVNNVQ